MAWESKIVRHSRELPSSLTGNPLNFRTHPKEQSAVVADSINEIGFVKSILVNEQTGYVLDGHERLWQALQEEERNPKFKVDVEWVSLSPEKEALALAILDPSSEMAGVDLETLNQLMHEIETGSEALNELIDSLTSDLVKELEESAEETEEKTDTVSVTDQTVLQVMTGDDVTMNVDGNLIQMVLPVTTVNAIIGLVIENHGGLSVR